MSFIFANLLRPYGLAVIEWIITGEDWPLAGTYRGHAGLADLLQKSEMLETSTEPREFVAQGDRVLVVGFAKFLSRLPARKFIIHAASHFVAG